MTYHEAHIAPLSPKQISKLLNAHPVRIKHGSHHKIHLSAEHHKKLHKAGLKGSALTVQLDPFAIAQNQHLRNDVKGVIKGLGMHHHMHGNGGTGHQLGNYIVTQGIEPLITASADRGVQALAGSGVRRGRPRKHHHHIHGSGGTGHQLGNYIVTQGIEPLITASADRGVQALAGSGVRRGRPRKHHEHDHEHHLHHLHHGVRRGRPHKGGIISAPTTPRTNPTNYLGPAGSGVRRGRPRKQHEHHEHHLHHLHHEHKHHLHHGVRRGRPRKHGTGISGVNKFDKYSSKIGDVLGLNSKAAQAAKKQIMGAVGNAGSTYIMNQVPGSYNAQPAPTKSLGRTNPDYSNYDSGDSGDSSSMMPMPKLKYSPNIPVAYAVEDNGDELPMPPTFSPYSATYAIPKGKLYASGVKRKPKVKRVMSEKQKAALAKGRHALRIKLNDMGAGAKKMHKSGSLRPAGYGI